VSPQNDAVTIVAKCLIALNDSRAIAEANPLATEQIKVCVRLAESKKVIAVLGVRSSILHDSNPLFLECDRLCFTAAIRCSWGAIVYASQQRSPFLEGDRPCFTTVRSLILLGCVPFHNPHDPLNPHPGNAPSPTRPCPANPLRIYNCRTLEFRITR
jgi:hypothetical protein